MTMIICLGLHFGLSMLEIVLQFFQHGNPRNEHMFYGRHRGIALVKTNLQWWIKPI